MYADIELNFVDAYSLYVCSQQISALLAYSSSLATFVHITSYHTFMQIQVFTLVSGRLAYCYRPES